MDENKMQERGEGLMQGASRTVLWLIAVGVLILVAGLAVYGGSKAFVRQFSLNLRADLVGKNIRVTDIEPGMVQGSEFSKVRFGGDDAKADAVYAGTNAMVPEDIAETAAWIIGLPSHVNVNRIELMPTCQAQAGFAVKRA